MSAGDDAAAICCGSCCICGFGALNSWCNQNAFGGRGGRGVAGCCGSCCNDSFDEDNLDKWEKDKANLRQPKPTEPMTIPAPPAESGTTKTEIAPAAAAEPPSEHAANFVAK